ncbi:MAG TPA: hypothetical protein VIL69_19080 [Roseomonas sp.]
MVAGTAGFIVALLGLIWIGENYLSASGWPVLIFAYFVAAYLGLGVWDSVISGPAVLPQLLIGGLLGVAALAALLVVAQFIASGLVGADR